MNKLLSILLLFTAITFTSCLKDDDTYPDVPVAVLRVINAYTNAESIVYKADNNNIIFPSSPLIYNTYTLNLALLYPGNRRLTVYDNYNKLISDTTVTLKDSTSYSSFVFGNAAEAKNLITKDVAISDLGTKTALRFFHLASNIANVNVYFDNLETPVYNNRAPQEVKGINAINNTTFMPHTSGKRKIIITDTQNNKLVEREYDFMVGKYYSLILVGDKNSTSKPLYLGVIIQ